MGFWKVTFKYWEGIFMESQSDINSRLRQNYNLSFENPVTYPSLIPLKPPVEKDNVKDLLKTLKSLKNKELKKNGIRI